MERVCAPRRRREHERGTWRVEVVDFVRARADVALRGEQVCYRVVEVQQHEFVIIHVPPFFRVPRATGCPTTYRLILHVHVHVVFFF